MSDIDLKSRYDIGWFSAYDTLKGMVILYGYEKVQEALHEILAAQLRMKPTDGGHESCPDCGAPNGKYTTHVCYPYKPTTSG